MSEQTIYPDDIQRLLADIANGYYSSQEARDAIVATALLSIGMALSRLLVSRPAQAREEKP